MTIATLLLAGALSAETLTLAALEQRVRALNREFATPILIGAVGPEAEEALEHPLRGLPARVVRVPTVGDPGAEMARALAAAGLRCGLRVEVTSGPGFAVEPFGDCGPSVPRVELPAPSYAAPVSPPSQLPPAPSAPAAAPPAAPPEGLDRGDLMQVARAWARTPEPAVAALESFFVGFGAGHFYAGNAAEGRIHLGVQAAGTATWTLGLVLVAAADDHDTVRTGSILSSVGLLTLSVGRVVDVYRAPLSAREERLRQLGR